MSEQLDAPIVIIGSGFAAYQLIKAIRRSDQRVKIQVFTADNGDDYNKPDLSHVVSKQQLASDLVRASGLEMAEQLNFELFANTFVDSIAPEQQQIMVAGKAYSYAKLVMATGGRAFVPPMSGNAVDRIVTLNSLQEYQAAEQELALAKRVLVIGGGLIGSELSMDLATAGKQVITVDPCEQLMANLLPEYIATELSKLMQQLGVHLALNTKVTRIDLSNDSSNNSGCLQVTLANGESFIVDTVISAAGLQANSLLAKQAGLMVNRGIVVDNQLQTSAMDVYALGDCAEIGGKVLAYLQPALVCANALAKTLLGHETAVVLPAMLVKVKTPHYPIQLAGQAVHQVNRWQLDIDSQGSCVQAFDTDERLQGFVVAGQHMSKAFGLLKHLGKPVA
ncbi:MULTISPECIES: NADH:flavorubredoxin reductase NorW [unclassified Shewanella]|uniref:NADH:flavorubredoxin reductase NorW n=1 Tax=unclassified Shewanella TaxID=196818 RepID=UPI001BB991E9|nr:MULTISPECIES: NADH:flavorubredoxin reductase NorW [unclassified Shewanella]GIU19826.1 nitric oxide reductase FlRd-NAD(+) reductase [Shewanella sp. MBTL60-112-B1]GIU27880.1 nitric oxide reductase FlRd-NAD(+) reductase [Shewanella sp. MBTL60-112-B2]